MREFRYPPVIVPVNLKDDAEIFAVAYPDHARWLADHGITADVTCYRWPEMLALILLHHPIGKMVCELQLIMADDDARAFADFRAIQPVDPLV